VAALILACTARDRSPTSGQPVATRTSAPTFTDIDVTSIPHPPGSIHPLFAAPGMVDTHLPPKLALAVWVGVYDRRRP